MYWNLRIASSQFANKCQQQAFPPFFAHMQKMHCFASLKIAKGHNAHLAFIYSAYETRTAFYNALKDADKRNPE